MPTIGKKGDTFVDVQLQADVRNLQAGLAAAVGQLKGFGASVTSLSKQLGVYTDAQAKAAQKTANTANQVTQIGSSMIATNKPLKDVTRNMALMTAALGGLEFLIIRTFANFEQSIANITAVTGATREEFDRLNKSARQFGETTIFTASQSADAMTELAKAGFNVSDTINSARGSLNLAAATNSDFATTTGIMVAALKQFQIETENSDRVANVFAAVIARSRASMDRLRDSLKFVGPVASSLNISLEQTVAALGILFNSGLEAAQAGTNLRQALIRLQAPTTKATKALGRLKLSLADVNPQTKNLVEILKAFEKVGAGATDKGDELADIFGRRAVTAMQVLIRTGGKALADLEAKITNTNEASRQAEIQINTLKGAWKLLTSVLQETAIQLGEALAPTLRFVQEMIRRMAKSFNSLPPIIKTIVANTGALTVAFGLFAVPLLFVVSRIPDLVASFSLLSATIGSFAPIIAGLTVVLGVATFALVKYFNSQEQNRRSTEKAIDKVKESLRTREREANQVNNLASEYISLAETANRTETQQKKLNDIEQQLATRYPALIDDTLTYADKLIIVKNAAKESAIELKKVAEEKLRIKKIELTLETSKLRRQAREIKEELSKVESQLIKTFEVRNITTSVQSFVDSLNAGDKILSNIVNNGYEYVLSATTLQNELRKVATTQGGINSLTKDLLRIGEKINQNEIIIAKKRAEVEIAQNNGVKITDEQRAVIEKVISETLKQNETLAEIEKSYSAVIGKAFKLKKLTLDIAENERLRMLLGQEKSSTTVDADVVVSDPQIDAADRAKNISQLVFDVKKAELQAEIDLAKQKDDEILQNKREAIDKEFNLKLFQLEREKELNIEKAQELVGNELQLKRDAINREFDLKREAIEKQKALAENSGLNDEFSKRLLLIENERQVALQKAEETMVDKVSIERVYNQQFLALVEERRNKLDETNQEQEQKEQERKDKMIEAQLAFNEISLEEYRAYLEQQLEAADEWSDRYIEILNRISAVERREERERVSSARRTANLIINVFDEVQTALERSASGMANAWKAAMLNVVDLFANHYANILRLDMIKALTLGDFSKVARDTAGIALIRGLQTVAKQAIKSAAVGADVKSAGVAVVHPGERIVPASIVRKTQGEFQRTAIIDEINRNTGNNNVAQTESFNAGNLVIENVHINNPMVGDQEFWDTIVEQNLSEAFDRIRRQQRGNV